MEKYRIERDSMGEMQVPAQRYWGAQTQRSFQNFPIGWEKMPAAIIRAFALLKKAAAQANHDLKPEKMTEGKCAAITKACDEIIRFDVFHYGGGVTTSVLSDVTFVFALCLFSVFSIANRVQLEKSNSF